MEKAKALFNITDNNVRKIKLRTIRRDSSAEDFDLFMDNYHEVFEQKLLDLEYSGLVGSKQEIIDQLRTLKRTTDPKFYSELIENIKNGSINTGIDTDVVQLTASDFNSV